jgi:hypothetical protein
MSTDVDRTLNAGQEPMEIPTMLEKWYATHASIRRLWAIEDAVDITVFVSLEPTQDGNDALPVWLANQHLWTKDLEMLIEREVQLKLVVSDFEELDVGADAVMLAELGWRDPWLSA